MKHWIRDKILVEIVGFRRNSLSLRERKRRQIWQGGSEGLKETLFIIGVSKSSP